MSCEPKEVEAETKAEADEKCTRCGGSGIDPHADCCGEFGPLACHDCDGSGKKRDWAEYWHDYDERYGIR